MSRSLNRASPLARQCEQHSLRRCALAHIQRHPTDDIRPLIPRRRNSPISPPQSQPFSTSRRWLAQRMPSTRKPSSPSMAVQYKQQKEKAVREGQIPDDLGLMQNTFIMPTGKNRPSWFSDFKRRWRLERVRWKTRWTEFFPYVAPATLVNVYPCQWRCSLMANSNRP